MSRRKTRDSALYQLCATSSYDSKPTTLPFIAWGYGEDDRPSPAAPDGLRLIVEPEDTSAPA
jgi:hypothetical protein